MPDWVGIYLPLSRGASLEQSLPCRHGCQTQQPSAAVAKLTGHRGINGAPGLMQMQACNNSLSPWLASCVTVCACKE